ncbi:MAG: hypothetical protein WDA59_01715 [Methanofastidiosum sp.]|jgi:hypothetical protein
MPAWKCKHFERKELDTCSWNPHLENCGLCINWHDSKCLHEDWLRKQGENDPGKEIHIRSLVISNNYDDNNGSSNGN